MQSKSTESDYEKFEASSYLDGNSAAYVDGLYEMFLHDPQSVPAEWMMYFQSLSAGKANIDSSHADIRSALVEAVSSPHQVVAPAVSSKQAAVDALINAFRRFGHLSANINPLQGPQMDRRLTLSFYELQDSDLQVDFLTRGVLPQVTASLREIHAALQLAYCQEVGFQCEHIESEEERAWLQNHIENNDVCLFMKGTPDAPQCGFSMAVSNMLKILEVNFKGINVLEDQSLREGVKIFSDWPTIPQLYIKKEFVGGCDIVKEMYETGELKKLLSEKSITFKDSK